MVQSLKTSSDQTPARRIVVGLPLLGTAAVLLWSAPAWSLPADARMYVRPVTACC